MLRHPLGRLRFLSFLEGLSFLVLLYFSIVEKRIKGHEEAIEIPGIIHGILFICFCLALAECLSKKYCSLALAFLGFVCSLLPFAPFWFERLLKKEQQKTTSIRFPIK